MERRTLKSSSKASLVRSALGRRTRSVLTLMPWEKRHQHSMKDYLKSPRKKLSFSSHSPTRYSATGTLNIQCGFETINYSPRKSLLVSEKNQCNSHNEGKIANLQLSGECSGREMITTGHDKVSTKHTPDICDASLCSQHVSTSDKLELSRKSLSVPQYAKSSLIFTDKVTFHHQSQPLAHINSDKIGKIDDGTSCAHALSNMAGSQKYTSNCSQQNIRFNATNDRMAKSPNGKYYNGTLNKTYTCAAKYSLDQIFTFDFPQVKKSLKQRLV